MGNTTGDYPIGEATWALAAILVLFVFGDVLVLLALGLALAAMAMAWWSLRQVQRGEEADLASVTELPGLSMVHLDPRNAPAQTLWHGPRVA